MAVTRICTPMHIRRKAVSRTITACAVGPMNPVGGSIQHPNDRGVGYRSDARAEKEGNESGAARGTLGADRDRDRDRAGSGGERQGQGKEGNLHRIAAAALLLSALVALAVGMRFG